MRFFSMESIPDQISEFVMDLTELDDMGRSFSEEYDNISTPPQPYDPSSYFDSCTFDTLAFQDVKGYEPYFSNLAYNATSTTVSGLSTYPTSTTSLKPSTNQEVPFRTRTEPRPSPSIGANSSSSMTESFNGSFPSPNHVTVDIGFETGQESTLDLGAQIQSVRNTQLEKRRAQNRNSQRAFRERKESYTNYLEQELACLREKYDTALRYLHRLRAAYTAIENLSRFDVAFREQETGIPVEGLDIEREGKGYIAK